MTDDEWKRLEPYALENERTYRAWVNTQQRNIAGLDERQRLEVTMAGERLHAEWSAARDAYKAAQVEILGRVVL